MAESFVAPRIFVMSLYIISLFGLFYPVLGTLLCSLSKSSVVIIYNPSSSCINDEESCAGYRFLD